MLIFDIYVQIKTFTLLENKDLSWKELNQDKVHVKGDICVCEELFANGDTLIQKIIGISFTIKNINLMR